MTGFAGHTPAQGTDDDLQVDVFYPKITTQNQQSCTRNDGEVQAGELAFTLRQAIILINAVLADFRAKQSSPTLGACENGSAREIAYQAAVFSRSKRLALAHYFDAATTGPRDAAVELNRRSNAYASDEYSAIRLVEGESGAVGIYSL